MSTMFYTEDEIKDIEYEGQIHVCEFWIRIGNNPSKYYYEDIEESKVYFIDDENGTAEEKLITYIQDMKAWYVEGHQGIEIQNDQWLEYSIQRFTGYENEGIDFYNPFGRFSAAFDDDI